MQSTPQSSLMKQASPNSKAQSPFSQGSVVVSITSGSTSEVLMLVTQSIHLHSVPSSPMAEPFGQDQLHPASQSTPQSSLMKQASPNSKAQSPFSHGLLSVVRSQSLAMSLLIISRAFCG